MRVQETALEADMDEHLGYEKVDVDGSGNSRNGTRTKTWLTVGPWTSARVGTPAKTPRTSASSYKDSMLSMMTIQAQNDG